MASKPKKTAKPNKPAEAPSHIGVATMSEDGTITLLLRAKSPKGDLGDAMLTYTSKDPKYASILKHLGGLKPGEEKAVPPFD
ncbi:MAG TPA: hypothetical protein VFE51_10075 [Verrucomicrobiae bacterium]|nr:hypothetical protein [Verrucomicrobiae bacterium]